MVDEEEVRKTAENARLKLSDDEVEAFTSDFEKILDMFSTLDDLEADEEPAFHPVDIEPDTREDVEEDTLSREETFQNTDNEEDGFFKGPHA